MPLHGESLQGPLEKPRSRAGEKQQAKRARGATWRLVRKAVLVRDNYRCRACGSQDMVDVHHLKFRSAGGTSVPSNLLAMCRCCHQETHAYRLFPIGANADGRIRFERMK